MRQFSVIALIEAGQIRMLASDSFRLPLPESLLWGPEVIARVESIAEPITRRPPIDQIESFVIVDRDSRRLTRGGASDLFGTPYQLKLLDEMVEAVWEGYEINAVAVTADRMREATGNDVSFDAGPESARLGDSSRSDGTSGPRSGDRFAGSDERDLPPVGKDGPPPAEDGPPLGNDGVEADGGNDAGDQAAHRDAEEDAQDEAEEHGEFDQQEAWWISVRFTSGEPGRPDPVSESELTPSYRHFTGSFDWPTLASSGPQFLGSLQTLPDAEIPDEDETDHGVVFDAATETIFVWSHPRGIEVGQMAAAWRGWSVEPWQDDGFRRQLRLVGDREHVVASDTEVLSAFVPVLVEQPDIKEMIGEIKSSLQVVVRRGFGCLAIVLAAPALLIGALIGSWQGPFAVAAGLWVIAFVGYRLLVSKVKRGFESINDANSGAGALFTGLAPESRSERERRLGASLAGAGLPSFEQVVEFAES